MGFMFFWCSRGKVEEGKEKCYFRKEGFCYENIVFYYFYFLVSFGLFGFYRIMEMRELI